MNLPMLTNGRDTFILLSGSLLFSQFLTGAGSSQMLTHIILVDNKHEYEAFFSSLLLLLYSNHEKHIFSYQIVLGLVVHYSVGCLSLQYTSVNQEGSGDSTKTFLIRKLVESLASNCLCNSDTKILPSVQSKPPSKPSLPQYHRIHRIFADKAFSWHLLWPTLTYTFPMCTPCPYSWILFSTGVISP